MKIWRSFSSDHSIDMTIIGEFESADKAKSISKAIGDWLNWSFFPEDTSIAHDIFEQFGVRTEDYKIDISDVDWELGTNYILPIDRNVKIAVNTFDPELLISLLKDLGAKNLFISNVFYLYATFESISRAINVVRAFDRWIMRELGYQVGEVELKGLFHKLRLSEKEWDIRLNEFRRQGDSHLFFSGGGALRYRKNCEIYLNARVEEESLIQRFTHLFKKLEAIRLNINGKDYEL